MGTLPVEIIKLLSEFAPLFDRRTWNKSKVLLIGAILCIGKRTVTSALMVMGYSDKQEFSNYHQVLNRASWSSKAVSEVLLRLLLRHLCRGEGPLVFGIDETIERRWGAKINARGIYRDAVRSSKSHFVKASGLRWVCLMWLTDIPWAQRVWALPFLTALAPSERFYDETKRSAKTLLDWARQMVYQLRRWLPDRQLVLVADSSYAALDFLHACQSMANPVAVITRLRLDAAIYTPKPREKKSKKGRKRKKGVRLPTPQAFIDDPRTRWQQATVDWYGGVSRSVEIASGFSVWYHSGKPVVPIRWVLIRDPNGEFEPLALLCTDRTLNPVQIVAWYAQRWQLEVTFEEARAHLDLETQRQWSDLVIARTTPALLGLFSWVTLVADALFQKQEKSPRQTAWYPKPLPTFSDALAWVRFELWTARLSFSTSPPEGDIDNLSHQFLRPLVETLCYAA
jgi:hypothetical protein